MKVKVVSRTVRAFALKVGFVAAIVAVLIPSPTVAEGSASRSALEKIASQVRIHTLSNGLRVIFYKRGFAPVFGGSVSVRVGGSDEPAGQTGIAHMFEHMAFKGTETLGTKNYSEEKGLLSDLEAFERRRSAGEVLSAEDEKAEQEINSKLAAIWNIGEFAKLYDEHGGVGLNATTDTELTRYFVELPRNSFEFWCWIESERLVHPVMRQFYKERDIVMEERRMRVDNDPEGKLYETLLGSIYRQHPYRNPVIGYRTDIEKLTASKVDAFRRKYYVPGNMVISLVGDVDPEKDLPIVERYFGRLPTGHEVERPSVVEPQQEGERQFTLELPASPVTYVAYRKPNYPDPDDAPISMLAEILSGMSVSPLYEELVKKSQKAVSVSHEEGPGFAYPNFMVFSLVPRSPHTNDDLLEAFDKVLDRVRKDGVKPELLEIAKRVVATEYLGQMKSNTHLGLNFASSELFYGDWKAFLDAFDRAMAVTSEDIKRVANKYFVRKNRTIGMVETAR